MINAYYQNFREEDWTARKKLGELNAKVFDELPLAPEGAIQTEFTTRYIVFSRDKLCADRTHLYRVCSWFFNLDLARL